MAQLQRIEIRDFEDPRIDDFRNLKDATLARGRGRFIVEGRGNLEVLLERSPHQPRSILLSERAYRTLSARLEASPPPCPVLVASQSLLDRIAGFSIHRGCLASCDRGQEADPLALAAGLLEEEAAPRILVLEGIINHDNVGSIFRNAMALGGRAVLLCPQTCDPLYRKSIRTSMGGALCVPFARMKDWPSALGQLRERGYQILAMDPAETGTRLEDLDARACGPTALLMGTEGAGLTDAALAHADRRVRIGMESGVDSLNVAVAAGIALHALRVAPFREVPTPGSRSR